MVVKRVFLAFPLVKEQQVSEKMQQLKKLLYDYRVKWVPQNNFHVTLFFFGEIPLNQISIIASRIDAVTANFSPFSFSIADPGIFKKGKEPRVLWLGIKSTESLSEIKKKIDESMAELGFVPGEKAYQPHLTLARFAARQEISPALQTALKVTQPTEHLNHTVSKLILFESILSPDGPRYEPIAVFPLNRPSIRTMS